MDELQSRLARCFLAVFPELTENGVRKASPASIAGWDSVATLNLIAVIEEEFGLQIDFVDLMQSLSFDLIALFLKNRLETDGTNRRGLEVRRAVN
jgi:acyl carrier protein